MGVQRCLPISLPVYSDAIPFNKELKDPFFETHLCLSCACARLRVCVCVFRVCVELLGHTEAVIELEKNFSSGLHIFHATAWSRTNDSTDSTKMAPG